MAPSTDPVADVWRSRELLGCVAACINPNHAAWSFIHVNKAAAAAYSDDGQLVSRTVSLPWALNSGLLTTLEGRIHARAMCYRLTLKQRADFLCRCMAVGCPRESLEGAVAAAGLSPPPTEVLVAAASAGRLAECRWLVERLGCPGLTRLACLCLISAAGPGPGVVEEARAWLAPAALEGWTEEQEAEAVSGNVEAVNRLLCTRRMASGMEVRWAEAVRLVEVRRQLEESPNGGLPWSAMSPYFYSGPHAALAVTRLASLDPSRLMPCILDAAAHAGHVEAVRYLLGRGVRPHADWYNIESAATAYVSDVAVLQALHEAGCMGDPARCFRKGLLVGSLPVIKWLLGTFGAATLVADQHPLAHAARSGSMTLLRALPELLDTAAPGWAAPPGAKLASPAVSGCEEAMVWLAEQGAPMRAYAYVQAASCGDLRMVQRLRKLGCPYDARAAEALMGVARRVPASASALPWLEEPGCPTSWEPAAAEARAAVEAKHPARAVAEAWAQAQAQLKAQARAHTEAQAGAVAEAQAQLKAQLKAQAQVHAQAQAGAVAEAWAQAQVQLDAQAQAHAQAQAGAVAEAWAQAQVQLDAQAQAHAQAQAGAVAEAWAQAQVQLDAQAQAHAQAQAGAVAEAWAQAQVQLDAQAQAHAQAQAATSRTLELTRSALVAMFVGLMTAIVLAAAELAGGDAAGRGHVAAGDLAASILGPATAGTLFGLLYASVAWVLRSPSGPITKTA
ncbi:hypothetical protein HYH03_002386 [Edaphochlamys debaryana]|uniref:Uncharacterized protein n=1 Tax=Edaphochlamys debaryana TaxID=47281 RepID=A0A835YCZ5_9CHLO|nr:hypothetical protein HYH03_002386 [Edaphochlamys debaryana]|eukprot:KAG2499439.1 hypothetical protein HYH03_002386 [Edaphochlamys debaryana]